MGFNESPCIAMMCKMYRETKSRIATPKAPFNKKGYNHQQSKYNLRKKLVKCYNWSIALYGDGTWTLWKVDQKYLGSSEMWCW
jgi:hypothetical protein